MATPTKQVGIREFRENLSNYLLKSEGPLAIMRHGDFLGYYIPAPRKRTEIERTDLERHAKKLQKEMEAAGLTEEDILQDFKQWRAAQHKPRHKQ